jgi:hypothetical protein
MASFAVPQGVTVEEMAKAMGAAVAKPEPMVEPDSDAEPELKPAVKRRPPVKAEN